MLTEEQYQASCDALSNIHQKRALLSQYTSDCQADAARYKEYQKRLGARLQQYQSVERYVEASSEIKFAHSSIMFICTL